MHDGFINETNAEFIDGIFKYRIMDDDYVFLTCINKSQLSKVVSDDMVLRIPGSVTYKGIEYQVLSIDSKLLQNCDLFEHLVIGEGIEQICTLAFEGCTNLRSVSIPSSADWISKDAFNDCPNLECITVDENNKLYCSPGNSNAIIEKCMDGDILVLGCKTTSIPKTVTVINDFAFNNCVGLTNIVIPEGVTELRDGAFAGCTNLQSVYIPKSLEEVGMGLFKGCSQLKSIVVDKGNELYDSRNNCNAIVRTDCNAIVSGCAFSTIVDGIEYIKSGAFSGTSITEIRIPKSVVKIENGAFARCTQCTSITVDKKNPVYESPVGSNVIIEKKTKTLLAGISSSVIPDYVEVIADGAFSESSMPDTFVIPDGVKIIGRYAFSGCQGIKNLVIPDSIQILSNGAFSYCRNLKNVQWNGVPHEPCIQQYVFAGCAQLEYMNIPDGITEICSDAFTGCANLKTVIMPPSVKTIGQGAFAGCPCVIKVAQPIAYGNEPVKISADGVTFIVDKNLPATDACMAYHDNKALSNRWMESLRVQKNNGFVATSFSGDSLVWVGADVMFKCIMQSYAQHRPLVLSPDMVWLAISQAFGHYVGHNAEKMREKFVSHTDKMHLVVESDKDLLSGNADWLVLLDDLQKQIAANTKGDIANVMTADFSTTTATERIASEITLMDAMKAYFEYVVFYASCGIPTITLKGTPGDWQKVLDKTSALRKYGMESWISELEPILEEFVEASKGHPNTKFWKNMVMQDRPERMRGGGCLPEGSTQLDGWFLKLFPYDKYGVWVSKVMFTSEMMPEMVRVDFHYMNSDGVNSTETPMELWAGFVGVKEDPVTKALSPEIGWMVRVADSDESDSALLKKDNLSLRVNEVPPVLSKMSEIKSLDLYFVDKVVLPDWMDNIKIDHFTIHGKMTEEEKAEIRKRFPNIKM